MLECDFLGMEVEARSLLIAIEWIAKDGGIQTLVMGAMHSKLMGATSLRK